MVLSSKLLQLDVLRSLVLGIGLLRLLLLLDLLYLIIKGIVFLLVLGYFEKIIEDKVAYDLLKLDVG